MKRWMIGLAAVVLLAAGCSGDDDGASGADDGGGAAPSTSAQADAGDSVEAGEGTCTVAITGDLEFQIDAPSSPVPTSSDYWLSDDELAQASSYLDDYDERVANGQQVIQLLQVSCGGGDLHLLIGTADATTRDDVPFEPGRYQVLSYLDAPDRPGITVGVTVPDPSNFGVTDGTIELTRFDSNGVAGTFEVRAEEAAGFVDEGNEPRHLTISGSFDIPCVAFAASLCTA